MGPFTAGQEPGRAPSQPIPSRLASGTQWTLGICPFGSGCGLPGRPRVVDIVAVDKSIPRFQSAFF